MGGIVVLAFTAALNPTELAAAASRHAREYGAWALRTLGVALAIPSVIALVSR